MDSNAVAGMVFTLILTGLIGGFILLHPLTKRLGALLERRLETEGRTAPAQAEVRRLAETVNSLEAELRMLKERQEFTENILASRERQKLPAEPPPT
jgi:chromosome segregation ATPase